MIKKLFSNYKLYTGLAVVVAGLFIYLNLPGQVKALGDKLEAEVTNLTEELKETGEELEEVIEINEDNIQGLAQEIEIYITEQRTIQKEQDKREALMLRLIEEVSKK